VYDCLKEVILTGYVIFINDHAFFITFSLKIKLVTTESLPCCTGAKKNNTALLRVQLFLMDMEFKKLTDVFKLVTINTTMAWEHVAGVEREIWVVKE
ncbi:hypothetical protein ACHAW6_013123, partial [Cyclotella cf. meneghiniana]